MSEYDKSRYYWIKLTDRFMTSDTVDFLMEQPNGSQYVVLYQMLCLKTVNQNGELSRKLNEIIIPYDETKIQRDLKYFSVDTVRVALDLYKRLGLIYEQDNGVLRITNFENLIGSQTIAAEKKQEQIARRNEGGKKVEKIPPIQDKDKDKDKDKELSSTLSGACAREDFDGEAFSDDLKFFCDKYRIAIDDYNCHLSELDFDVLDKAYAASKWLRDNFTVLSKVCKHYAKIIAGTYADEVVAAKSQSSQHTANSRTYTKEELEKLLTNIDDLEL